MNISLEGIASIFLEGNEWLWERRTQKLLGIKWNEIIPLVQTRILKTSASLVHALQNSNPGKEAVLGRPLEWSARILFYSVLTFMFYVKWQWRFWEHYDSPESP